MTKQDFFKKTILTSMLVLSIQEVLANDKVLAGEGVDEWDSQIIKNTEEVFQPLASNPTLWITDDNGHTQNNKGHIQVIDEKQFDKILLSPPVQLSNELLIQTYQTKAKNEQLYQDKVWQRLLYADKNDASKVTFDGFFLSDYGKTDLQAEMMTTIHHLFVDMDEGSPQCRFPARTQWLMDKLGIDKEQLPVVLCQEFDDWFQAINPHSMTLIFASDYMGNPGSMFGHTLIRINPIKDANKNMDLVSYALNYAAVTPPNENSAAYAFKGLTGKYLGEYSLMRYFHKTKEYGDIEGRDIWEYELALTPDEVEFLVKHIWEMKQVRFPYYFMEKNCSYALLGLMDLVRPELNLQSQFGWTVVPIETVKAVKRAGLVYQENYRPALETHLQAQEQAHGRVFSRLAHQLSLQENNPSELLADQSKANQAALLEMAYDDLYLQHVNKKVANEFAQTRLRELLLLRSQLEVPKQRIVPTTPSYDPTRGHGDKSWGVGVGQSQGENVVNLSHRIAYHGFGDPYMGYATGQLLFLNGALQLQDGKLKLDYLDLLNVHAINPVTSYKRPYSWGTEFGFKRIAVDDAGEFSTNESHSVGAMAVQFGYAWSRLNHKAMCGLFARAEMQIGKSLVNNMRVGVSPKIHCLWRYSDKVQGQLTANVPFWFDKSEWQRHLGAEIQYNITPHSVIRLGVEHQSQKSEDWHKVMFGVQRYY